MSGMDIKDGRLVLLGAHDGNAMDSVQAGEIAAMARELYGRRRASQAAPAPSDGLREAVDAAWNDAIEAAAEKLDLLLPSKDAIRALRRAAPTEGEA